MKIFSEISSRDVSISKFQLDPNNPRLRLHPGGTSEKDLIERLCKLGPQSPSQVIKHILADRGYLHNEIPVVYKESIKSKLIVIDGNRRIAALKMVHDPSLIPSTRHGLRSDCEKLRGLVPERIHYWIAKNLSDAKRIVYRAHNEGTREWETLARYATHYDYHKDGQSISEIAEITGSPQKDVRDQINAWLLYEAMISQIPGFEIEDEGITNFERVTTSYAAFPKRLGISLSAEGIYQIPVNTDIVQLIHKAFLKSAKSPGFTRTVGNNDESRDTFWNHLLPVEFNPVVEQPTQKPQSVTASDTQSIFQADVTQPTVDTKSTEVSSKSGTGQSKTVTEPLVSDREILSIKKNVGKKSHEIFSEYVKLQQGGDYPIASAALTRALIETTLKHHAKRLNCYEETSDQQKRQQSDMLNNIADRLKKTIAGLNLAYSSDLLSSIGNCLNSIPELNDVMHKDGTFAARPAVKTAIAALASAVENLVLIPDGKAS